MPRCSLELRRGEADRPFPQEILYILFIHVEKNQKNMDAQDAQDNQDGTLLQGKLAPAMIRYGFADALECRTSDL